MILASVEIGVPASKRIVFLGDSITENGMYIRYLDAYILKHLPERRVDMINLGVSSETASGTDEPGHPFPRPCVHERLERALAESKPEWVLICYGMNDGIYHPFDEGRFRDFQEGITKAVERVKAAGARPFLMTPPPFDALSVNGALKPKGEGTYGFETPYDDYNDAVLGRYASWVTEYGGREGISVINIRDPLMRFISGRRDADPSFRYGDGVHPSDEGHWIIARTIMSRVFRIEWEVKPDWVLHPDESEFMRLVGERRTLLNSAWREHVGHTNPYKSDTFPLEKAQAIAEEMLPNIRVAAEREGGALSVRYSSWNGAVRRDFTFDGFECVMVEPAAAAPGRRWVWRTEFFGAFADADAALLRQGWHVAYIRLSHLYGSPAAAEQMEKFRRMLTEEHQLSTRPALFGFSRGGLYALRYASLYPQHTAMLYLDAPVVDIRSWPGGAGEGTGSPEEWQDCLSVYGVTAEQADGVTAGLLDGAAKITDAAIPVLLISGDADRIVPYTENGALVVKIYRERGGIIRTILKPGGDHHPHSLPDIEPIVEFVVTNGTEQENYGKM